MKKSIENHYLSVLKKYGDWSGRSSRAEFWYFVLFNFIIGFVLEFIELSNLYLLFVLIPSTAVSIRRTHDVNKSGWFNFIPLYSFLLLIRDGTKGDNQYGPDPREMEGN